MPTVQQQREKLIGLLKQLFQLDQPELDFGFYRIMHAKANQVTKFLEDDLLKIIVDAFGELSGQPVQKRLNKARQQVEGQLGASALNADGTLADIFKETPVGKEYISAFEMARAAADTKTAEGEVYDHLYRFFERYYEGGDFISKRYLTRETSGRAAPYAIPYNGEEVKLHWANSDQYYIKTAEYFTNFTFKLRPEDTENPLPVTFKIVDATEGEHGNVKASNGQKRYFILHSEDPVGVENGALVVRFEYRPDPEKTGQDAVWQGKRNEEAEKAVLAALEGIEEAREYLEALRQTAPTNAQKDRTLLGKYVARYSARNTMDYFIHKNLGDFLRRELDYYIKNEVMRLDDIESADAPRVEQYLNKIKVLRKIAGKLIDFLAQLEDFQKKLWLKKKFVVDTQYCITLSQIPEEFYPEIIANDAQREEWVRLFAIDEIKGDLTQPGYTVPLKPEFLKAHPTLVVDTKHFTPDFKARLLDKIDDLEEKVDGVLFHSENFQALALMQTRYREQVKCIYIDPPYNTGSDGFPYKDSYRHASWMSMLVDRTQEARKCLSRTGVLFCSIDENEVHRLYTLLADVFGEQNYLADIVWQGSSKNDQRYLSISHEYMLTVLRDKEYLDETSIRWLERKEGLDDIYAAFERIKKRFPDDYEKQSAALKEWYAGLKPNHPAKAQSHFNRVERRGIYFPDNISKPAKGYYYDVIHPISGKPCAKPKGGWRFIESTMKEELSKDNIHFGKDENSIPCRKSFLHETEYMSPRTVIYQDGRAATAVIRDLFGDKNVFANPKDHNVLGRLFKLMVEDGDLALDFFAGSGTTGHAVINLNREDGGTRKFILVEMGDYFDTVLLPRLKKVTFTPEWKDGKPKRMATAEEAERSPRIIKVIRLESYEDTLNNLEFKDDEARLRLIEQNDGLREDYMLHYMLDVETRGSQSLLNIDAFADPTAYKLKVKKPGSDEYEVRNVDLLETFNYLIGLRVEHISAPQVFAATFKREPDPELPADSNTKLIVDGRIRQDTDGPWWFRKVEGWTTDGNGGREKVLIVWRKLTGDIEKDNLMLDEWFKANCISTQDFEYDTIYVNGSNNLPNLKREQDNWKVRLIEEDFFRLMWDVEDV